MPDMQKVEMLYTLQVSGGEMSFICNALRGRDPGTTKFSGQDPVELRELWLELAEKLIRQQLGWFDRNSEFLTGVLERFLAEREAEEVSHDTD